MGDGKELKRILRAAADAADEDAAPEKPKTEAETLLTDGPVPLSEPYKPGNGRIPENVMFMHPDSFKAFR